MAGVALHRARAAEHRAHAHEHTAAAIDAGTAEEAERHLRLQAAAQDRARSFEQLAFADEARMQYADRDDERASIGRPRAEMHLLWARMHEHLARARELQADGDPAGADHEYRHARACEERARAANDRAESAEHDAEATAAGADGRGGEEDAALPDDAAEHDAAEHEAAAQRIRARLERRRQRERSGLRRYRPGPGYGTVSPTIMAGPPPPEESLDTQIETIRRVLDDQGPTERIELARRVGARYWGPGVFRAALRIAIADGEVRRIGRTVYAPR